MSGPFYQLTLDGQAPFQDQINATWRESALADDHVFAELFRLAQYNGVVDIVDRAILPFGYRSVGTDKSDQQQQVVTPSTGAVRIRSFRAIIGNRSGSYGSIIGSPGGTENAERQVDVRSGIYINAGDLDLPANSSGSTVWVCVYARVSVATATLATRYGRASDGTVGAHSVNLYTQCTVTVGVDVGLPNDDPANGIYYIILAYVRTVNGFGPTTPITLNDIRENSDCATPHFATGAVSSRPANYCWSYIQWPNTGDRPNVYLPSTMVGGQSIWLPLQFVGTPSVIDGDIVDDQINWKFRLFHWTACKSMYPFAFQPTLADNSPHVPGITGASCEYGMGQSMHYSTADERWVAYADLSGGTVHIMVDGSGRLVAGVTGAPTLNVIFHITASGQFIPR